MKNPYQNLAHKYSRPEPTRMRRFHKEALIARFQQDTEPREYFDTYRVLFFLALGLSFLMQGLSAYSSYHYLDGLLAVRFQLADLRLTLTLLVLFLIEVLKYHFYSITLQKAFARPREYEPVLILLTLVISAFSFYASISGGEEMGSHPEEITALESSYNTQIKAKEAQIADIQSSDAYKEIRWLGRGETAKVLSAEGLSQIQKREAELAQLREEKDQELNQLRTTDQQNQREYQYWFGSFEVFFVLCQLFIWHFKRSSAQDREVQAEEERTKQLQSTAQYFKAGAEALRSSSKLNSQPLRSNPRSTARHCNPPPIFQVQKVKVAKSAKQSTLKPASLHFSRPKELRSKSEALQSDSEEETEALRSQSPLLQSSFKAQSQLLPSHCKVIPLARNPVLRSTSLALSAQPQALRSSFKATTKLKPEVSPESLALQKEKARLQAEREAFEAIKEQFEATVKSVSVRSAAYLRKYEAAVKLILQRQAEQRSDAEVRQEITAKFHIGNSTYYGIKRILSNLPKA